jgi:hypothetical protein
VTFFVLVTPPPSSRWTSASTSANGQVHLDIGPLRLGAVLHLRLAVLPDGSTSASSN